MDREVVMKLVYSMIKFLKEQIERGSSSLSEEGAEGVEVAVQCLETAYGISSDSVHLTTSQSLYSIFSNAVKDEMANGPDLNYVPSEEEKLEAVNLKNEGNKLMREEKFDKALECYTKAIIKDKVNAVYYCNRAAAHSKLNNHLEAIEDCKRALRIEPNYSKAYGRMGLAYSALDKVNETRECYKKALEVEPDNESYQTNFQIAEEKLKQSQQNPTSSQPLFSQNSGSGATGGLNLGPLGGLAASLAGGAGGSGPDLQGLFNNPALMSMATSLMQDPNMQNVMSSMIGSFTGAPAPAAPPSTSSSTTETGNQSAQSGASAGSQGGAGGMDAFLQAGRQLAERLQNQNPELVDQLRNQMNRNGSQGQDGSGPGQTPP